MAATAIAFFVFVCAEKKAAAQGRFGDQGQLAITGENLFAWQTERVSITQPTGNDITTSTRFGFLYSQGSAQGPHGPQAGVHYFIIPSLSIGGTLGYESRGGSNTRERNTMPTITVDTTDFSIFTLQPKVGYALMLNDVLGFWFRAGLGFWRIGASNPGGTKASETAWFLSADALFVVNPFQHFALYVGPQGDLSFAGSASNTAVNGVETSQNRSYRDIGIGFGLIGYLGL